MVDENERSRLLPSRISEVEEQTSNGDNVEVDWDGPDDPQNPRNWRPFWKWLCVLLVSLYATIAATASSMVVPAMPALTIDLGLTSPAITQLTLSIFVLGWGIGPLILAPLSEIYGRAVVLNAGMFGFLCANTFCGLANGQHSFLAFRFLSGVMCSGPMTVGAAVLNDLWPREDIGLALAVYTVLPLLGPTAGPVLGGVFIEHNSWRVIFYACSLVGFFVFLACLLILSETFGPVLLNRKRVALLRVMHPNSGENNVKSKQLGNLVKIFRVDLPRPFVLLGTQPIIQIMALYMGLLFGLNHLTISTFHALWREHYHESDSVSSLNYFSISIGFLLGAQIAGPTNDKIYTYLKSRNNDKELPEYRSWLMIPASLCVPLGLLCYGWSAAAHLHWTMPNLGIIIYSFGLIMGYQCIQAYILDSYPVYAASAMGALSVCRSLSGFFFPLVAPSLYRALGYGWTSTLLAAIALLIGVPAPWVLRSKGEFLRARSPFAAGYAKVTF